MWSWFCCDDVICNFCNKIIGKNSKYIVLEAQGPYRDYIICLSCADKKT